MVSECLANSDSLRMLLYIMTNHLVFHFYISHELYIIDTTFTDWGRSGHGILLSKLN